MKKQLQEMPFEDVVGEAPEGTYKFALRRIKLDYFDTKRCVCHLKAREKTEKSEATPSSSQKPAVAQRSLGAMIEATIMETAHHCTDTGDRNLKMNPVVCPSSPSNSTPHSFVLRFTNLEFRMHHDWEAQVRGEWVTLEGENAVSVSELSADAAFIVDVSRGVRLESVRLDLPQLDLALSSRKAPLQGLLLQALSSLFHQALKRILQRQMEEALEELVTTQVLTPWNDDVWTMITSLVPAHLLSRGIGFVASAIPKQGIVL